MNTKGRLAILAGLLLAFYALQILLIETENAALPYLG